MAAAGWSCTSKASSENTHRGYQLINLCNNICLLGHVRLYMGVLHQGAPPLISLIRATAHHYMTLHEVMDITGHLMCILQAAFSLAKTLKD